MEAEAAWADWQTTAVTAAPVGASAPAQAAPEELERQSLVGLADDPNASALKEAVDDRQPGARAWAAVQPAAPSVPADWLGRAYP